MRQHEFSVCVCVGKKKRSVCERRVLKLPVTSVLFMLQHDRIIWLGSQFYFLSWSHLSLFSKLYNRIFFLSKIVNGNIPLSILEALEIFVFFFPIITFCAIAFCFRANVTGESYSHFNQFMRLDYAFIFSQSIFGFNGIIVALTWGMQMKNFNSMYTYQGTYSINKHDPASKWIYDPQLEHSRENWIFDRLDSWRFPMHCNFWMHWNTSYCYLWMPKAMWSAHSRIQYEHRTEVIEMLWPKWNQPIIQLRECNFMPKFISQMTLHLDLWHTLTESI